MNKLCHACDPVKHKSRLRRSAYIHMPMLVDGSHACAYSRGSMLQDRKIIVNTV